MSGIYIQWEKMEVEERKSENVKNSEDMHKYLFAALSILVHIKLENIKP